MKQLYSLVRFANKQMDLPYPVKVRRCKMPRGFDGDCQFKENHFLIRIDRDLNLSGTVDATIHEISHCLAWHEEDPEGIHGPAWGLAYSKVYRKFLEWLDQTKGGVCV